MHAPGKNVRKIKPAGYTPTLFSSVRSGLARYGLGILMVVIPTLISALYFGFVASDIYTSQSCFVVQSPHMQTGLGVGSLLASAGLSGSSESSNNAYTVEDYILSRDALTELNRHLDLRTAWSSDKIDFLRRFGLFGFRNDFEHLYLYYQGRIDLELGTTSNDITLSVNDFSAQRAVQINQTLLQSAEHLVNKLNVRMQQDLIGFAETEVESSRKEVEKTGMAVSDYRNGKIIVDPVQQATIDFELISNLESSLIATKTELTNLRTFAPNSPVPPTLELKASTLQTAIDAEMAKAAGNKDSLSSKDAQYQQLILEQGLAAQQLAAAQAALLSARVNAQQQQLYLEIVAQPSTPDAALDPKRIEYVLVTFVVGLIAWGIASMLIAGIREHQL